MKAIKTYIVAGVIFVSVLGTFLHFAYDLFGGNTLIGLFSPVNESIWEHTKLIYFPMLFYSLFMNKKIATDYPCVSSATRLSLLISVYLIISSFYTYSGIIGTHIAFIDIAIFYISVIISFYILNKLTLSCKTDKYNMALKLLNILLISCYIIFTFYPPNIPLFINP